MPFISVMIAAPQVSEDAIAALHDGVTALMARILRKDPHLTSVLVDVQAPQRWAIGGRPAPLAAHLDARITKGTNSPAEKAAFIAAAADLLRRTLGAVPVATYVVITEIPAEDWGYDGKTQAARKPT